MKKLTVLLCLALLLCLLPVRANANGPAPSSQLELSLRNPPEGTVYVDLLIPLPTDDPYYKNLANLPPEGMGDAAPIVNYHDDGYCSYTFHYYDANALSPWEPNGIVTFEDYHVLKDYGKIRIAMLDSEGNILKISEELSLASQGMFFYTLGGYTYDCATDEWIVEQAFGVLGVLVYLFISFGGLVFTCLTEWLVSFPFRLRRSWTIVITNIISQVFMRLLFVLLYGTVIREYWMTTLVLEVAVYIGEGLFYCLRFKDTSWKKVIAYTVVANTASLVLGLWMNYYYV